MIVSYVTIKAKEALCQARHLCVIEKHLRHSLVDCAGNKEYLTYE